MPVRHPLAERDAAPAAVTVGTTTYAVRDGVINCPPDREDAVAEAVADAHDMPREAVYEEDGSPDSPGTCSVEKHDGEICGRERPCPYHDE